MAHRHGASHDNDRVALVDEVPPRDVNDHPGALLELPSGAGAPDPGLGELAEVTIRLEKIPRALVVPTAAVKRVEQRPGVWQVADGRTRFRPVTLGLQTLDGRSQAIDGLESGDAVIVYSTAELREGMKVRVEGAS